MRAHVGCWPTCVVVPGKAGVRNASVAHVLSLLHCSAQPKEKSKALSFEDLNQYSNALELYDKGKKADAKKIATKITNKYPDFEAVKNLLKKL
jgi:hypothetical protein